jgi:hypothetical protein
LQKPTFDGMRFLAQVIAILFILPMVIGQNESDSKSLFTNNFKYGLTPKLNIAVLEKPDLYSASIGYGLDFYTSYKFTNSPFKISSTLGYSRYGYEYNNFKFNTDNANILLGLTFISSSLGNSGFTVGYKPSYTLYGTSNYLGATNPDGPNFSDITSSFKNRFSNGIYGGFQFNLNDKSTVEIGYTHFLNQNTLQGFVDAQTNNISIGLNVDLGKNWSFKDQHAESKNSLNQLQGDTLYFINRSCEGELSNKQLETILSSKLTFCNYKVLKDHEIASVRKQSNVVHFAVIGQYYASEGDPLTNGIYLLDKNMEITTFPYPFYTYVTNMESQKLDLCFNELKFVELVVAKFNVRLNKAISN